MNDGRLGACRQNRRRTPTRALLQQAGRLMLAALEAEGVNTVRIRKIKTDQEGEDADAPVFQRIDKGGTARGGGRTGRPDKQPRLARRHYAIASGEGRGISRNAERRTLEAASHASLLCTRRIGRARCGRALARWRGIRPAAGVQFLADSVPIGRAVESVQVAVGASRLPGLPYPGGYLSQP